MSLFYIKHLRYAFREEQILHCSVKSKYTYVLCIALYPSNCGILKKKINVTIILLTTYLIHKLTEVTKHKRRKFQ